MAIEIIKQRLKHYQCNTQQEEESALKEITQELILLSLSKQNFFKVAEFHGGTALRILHHLQRFSEDLDFALLKPTPSFDLMPYLTRLNSDLNAYGYDFEIVDRSKASNVIKKAFLKDHSLGKLLILNGDGFPKKISIKLEVDSNPPLGANTKLTHLNFPYTFSVLTKDLESAFSGKIHALLCRPYIKGRDWFDFLWFIMAQTKPNFTLLENALQQHGPWQGTTFECNKTWLINALNQKTQEIDWQIAQRDVFAFLKPELQSSIDMWSCDFFKTQLSTLSRYI